MTKPSVLIMAGGTGGHIFPALAVAHYLQLKGWDIHWLGTKAGLEADLIPKHQIPLHFISVQGLRGTGLLRWILAPLKLLSALIQSLKLLHKIKPNLVIGMGGFVSGPGGVAAWLARYPLLIHEQNSIVGLTNRCLSHLADQVLEGFPKAFPKKTGAIYTGNPVRQDLLNLPKPKDRFQDRTGPIRLLVIGGSRGAIALNEVCPKAIHQLPLKKHPLIWHQTGKGRQEATQQLYKSYDIDAKVTEFIDDMAAAYEWADLVLCRSGALTIAELAAVGVGSILVPYPFAVDDHQRFNGLFLQKVGAAHLVPQSSLEPNGLCARLEEMFSNRDSLLAMAQAAYRVAKRDAVAEIGACCEETGNYELKKV